MSVTEEIKARLDIVSYIQQYVPLKKAGRYYKACCPFHAERTPSFVVNPDTQTWRCYGACAEGGDLFSFAQKQHGWNFPEALEELSKAAGVEVRKQTSAEREQGERLDRLRGILKTAADIYHQHLMTGEGHDVDAVRDYAHHKRGLTDDTLHRFQIGYAPSGWQNMLEELKHLGYDEEEIVECGLVIRNDQGRVYDRFRNRLVMPIRDIRGRVIGFGARALDPDDNPKYLNSPQSDVFDKSRTLFGLDLAKDTIRDQETVVIVEGYMDVIQAHQAGFTNVVAQMGTAMTEAQIKLVAPRYAHKIIMALDSDAAGQNATRRSLETARKVLAADFSGQFSVDIRVLQIPGAKDPDDLIRESPDQWLDEVQKALPVADFVIGMETASLAPDASLQEREMAARRILPLLVASENNMIRRENIQKLALRLRIGERDLLNWADTQKMEKPRPAAPEPPPLDYESMEPPPEIEDEIYEPPPPPDLPEAHTLRLLCRNPDVYYQINRKFRELAMNDMQLESGPLCDLGTADFSHADYRRIMEVFTGAISQHDMEIEEYLREHMDLALMPVLEALLADDREVISQTIGLRFGEDVMVSYNQHQRYAQPGRGLAESLTRAIQLRHRRLKREWGELSLIQLEFQNAGDKRKAFELLGQVTLSKRAIERLDMEVQHQRSQLA